MIFMFCVIFLTLQNCTSVHLGTPFNCFHAGVPALFDVDGTLTAAHKDVTLEMLEFMMSLCEVRPECDPLFLLAIHLFI
jgi:hypothetical protein